MGTMRLNPDKTFEVNLIPYQGSEVTKTFRVRGVAEAYEQFDRPERCDLAIIQHAQPGTRDSNQFPGLEW